MLHKSRNSIFKPGKSGVVDAKHEDINPLNENYRLKPQKIVIHASCDSVSIFFLIEVLHSSQVPLAYHCLRQVIDNDAIGLPTGRLWLGLSSIKIV